MNRVGHLAPRALLLVGSAVAWEVVVRALHVPAFVLPPPSHVAVALQRGIASGVYLAHLWTTLAETVLGFLLGSAVAVVLGIALAASRRTEGIFYPFIVMFQSMPKVALAPLIVIWLGLGIASKVVGAALVAFFPLLVNTIVGLRSADEERTDLMRSFGATQLQIYRMLRLPSALPFIMAGLEVSLALSLVGALVAEFAGAEAGLGMLIQSRNASMDVAGEFAILFILASMGLVLNAALVFVRRRALFWDPSQKEPPSALIAKEIP